MKFRILVSTSKILDSSSRAWIQNFFLKNEVLKKIAIFGATLCPQSVCGFIVLFQENSTRLSCNALP
jgi:hypothetical protein